jgi:hypothetical protein
MTDTHDSTPPNSGFPGFPGFPSGDMLERMWGMMRLSPFGSAFSGGQAAGGMAPSLSMMSDMMAPLTNVEELDKRITDMRAVEQWLKLNLSMLQSAIQALEVQRATLATLRAFGAFAQQSMSQPSSAAAPAPGPSPATGWPHMPASGSTSSATGADTAPERRQSWNEAGTGSGSAPENQAASESAATPPFDASAWWNLLQTQFNQIAQFAMTQPSVAVAAAGGGTASPQDNAAASAGAEKDNAPDASDAAADAPHDPAGSARRPAAKRAPAATKRAASASTSARTAKKSL